MANKAVFCIAGSEEQAIGIANMLKAEGFFQQRYRGVVSRTQWDARLRT